MGAGIYKATWMSDLLTNVVCSLFVFFLSEVCCSFLQKIIELGKVLEYSFMQSLKCHVLKM